MPVEPEDGRTTSRLSVDLDLHVDTRQHATVIAINGEIDLASAPQMRERLLELAIDGQVNQFLDMTGVTFLDSAGLGALVAVRRRARTLQGGLALAGANATVLRLLRLTSLDKVLPSYATVDEAITAEFTG